MGSSTPTPWARGNPSLGGVVREQKARQAQLGRQSVDVTTPNVFSSDGGKLIIPGRRDMPSNAGRVLTVNATEDAYELTAPASGGGGSAGYAALYSNTMSSPSGYPSFDDWQIEEDTIGVSTTGDHLFTVPAGLYMGRLRFNVTVVSPAGDLSVSANIFSSSAYVTCEFPSPVARPSGDLIGSYTIGPLPVGTGEGEMSASFFYPESAGVPNVDGSCTYFLAKLA